MKELTKDKLFTIAFTTFIIFMIIGWLYGLENERKIPWIDRYDRTYGR